MTGNNLYQAAVGVAVAVAFTLVWINLAVGISGSEDNPAYLMYGGVLAVGIIDALIARFQLAGMVRGVSATALAQAFVGVIALTGEFGSMAPSFREAILFLTGFFATPAAYSGLAVLESGAGAGSRGRSAVGRPATSRFPPELMPLYEITC